jgi:putative membrane protein
LEVFFYTYGMVVTAKILIAIIAIEHLVILWIEMFGWETIGKKVFTSLPQDLFKPTKMLAANQGLYNGFLSAGLIWSLLVTDAIWQNNIALFFVGCVIIAGIYGAITSSKKIFFVQALPAVITFIIVLLSR